MALAVALLPCGIGIPASGGETECYRHPITPESEEWRGLGVRDPEFHALQLPDEVIAEASTACLLTCCLRYVPATLMAFYNRVVTGVRFVIDHFNGMTAFLAREDAPAVAAAFYEEMTPAGAQDVRWWEFEPGKYEATHVEFMELLLAQPELLNRTSRDFRSRLLRTVLEFEDERAAKSLFGRQKGYYLMARLLDVLGCLPELGPEHAAALRRFLKEGPIDAPNPGGFREWDELMSAARSVLGGEE